MTQEDKHSDAPVIESAETQPGGPLGKVMPPDMSVWHEARRLVADKSLRVEDLATACAQDPVIVLELIKIANAMYFSGGRADITSVKTALVRLGSDVTTEQLDNLGQRPQIKDKALSKLFEGHRTYAKRVSITATIVAQAVARSLTEDCQTCGLFMSLGEMLAVIHFADQYIELKEEYGQRHSINYQLSSNFRFDVEKMGIKYLSKNGIPEALITPLDRDNKPRSQDRAIIRPICFSASEMVDAFDNNKWEKLAPGKNLPSKSSIRLLGLDDAQYLKIYERVGEYLYTYRQIETRSIKPAVASPEPQSKPVLTSTHLALESELDDLLSQTEPETSSAETQIESVDYNLHDPEDNFSLNTPNKKSTARVVGNLAEKIKSPKLRTAKGTKTVAAITDMFGAASSSEDLLARLLDQLVTEGPFNKAALIVVSRDRKHAIVVAARGPNIGNGQKLELSDPLSPLAQCFSKVQSFGNRPNDNSPFGSKAFALAPVQADHETPVALYADCGNDASLTFEARRIFRTVVDILNERLPYIPGGIPVEL